MIRSKLVRGCLVAACLGMFAAASFAESLEDVQKEIIAKQKKLKSFTADLVQDINNDMGGMNVKIHGEGNIAVMRKGDNYLARMEMKQDTDMGSMKMSSKIIQVQDESAMTMLSEQMGQKQAMKMKADQSSYDPNKMFETMSKDYELKLLDSKELDGEKVWAVEATAKNPQPSAPTRLVLYFRQADGILTQQEGYTADGNKMMTIDYKNIKTDENLDPKMFNLEIPEGVTVQDMTKQ